LPTGTLTFLFTDIEGSTQLWEQSPEAMQAALADHDGSLRHAIESSNSAEKHPKPKFGTAKSARKIDAADAQRG
jgi:hypothetical protein